MKNVNGGYYYCVRCDKQTYHRYVGSKVFVCIYCNYSLLDENRKDI